MQRGILSICKCVCRSMRMLNFICKGIGHCLCLFVCICECKEYAYEMPYFAYANAFVYA